MKLLKNRVKHSSIFGDRSPRTRLVSLFINDGNPRINKFVRTQLQKPNWISRLMQNVKIKHLFSGQDTVTSNKLVKKCVRIDNYLLKALRREVGTNESFISKTVADAVLNKINSRVIDVIRTKNFRHRITVRFTQKQYKLVKETIDELKEQGIKGITFSLLVRSILYEHFGIVTEIENEVNRDVA